MTTGFGSQSDETEDDLSDDNYEAAVPNTRSLTNKMNKEHRK